MTRRSIYIGIAAILALALTTGFAWAGAMGGRQAHNHPASQRHGTTSVMPGSLWNNRGQASQVSGYGPAFRSQMHGWMQNRMGNHDRNERSWTPMGYSRQGAQGSGPGSSGYWSGTHNIHNGYGDDHHATSGHWGGSGSGGHGYDHGYGHDGDHGCW